jgi:hypothetical protein
MAGSGLFRRKRGPRDPFANVERPSVNRPGDVWTDDDPVVIRAGLDPQSAAAQALSDDDAWDDEWRDPAFRRPSIPAAMEFQPGAVDAWLEDQARDLDDVTRDNAARWSNEPDNLRKVRGSTWDDEPEEVRPEPRRVAPQPSEVVENAAPIVEKQPETPTIDTQTIDPQTIDTQTVDTAPLESAVDAAVSATAQESVEPVREQAEIETLTAESTASEAVAPTRAMRIVAAARAAREARLLEEQAEAEKAQAEAEQERLDAEQARLDAEKARAEAEQQRLDAEKAESERARAEQAASRAAEQARAEQASLVSVVSAAEPELPQSNLPHSTPRPAVSAESDLAEATMARTTWTPGTDDSAPRARAERVVIVRPGVDDLPEEQAAAPTQSRGSSWDDDDDVEPVQTTVDISETPSATNDYSDAMTDDERHEIDGHDSDGQDTDALDEDGVDDNLAAAPIQIGRGNRRPVVLDDAEDDVYEPVPVASRSASHFAQVATWAGWFAAIVASLRLIAAIAAGANRRDFEGETLSLTERLGNEFSALGATQGLMLLIAVVFLGMAALAGAKSIDRHEQRAASGLGMVLAASGVGLIGALLTFLTRDQRGLSLLGSLPDLVGSGGLSFAALMTALVSLRSRQNG